MLFVSIRDLAAHAVCALLCTMRGRVRCETCGARLDQLARMVRYSAVSLWNPSSQTNACRQLRARKNCVFLMSVSSCCIYSRCVECVFFSQSFHAIQRQLHQNQESSNDETAIQQFARSVTAAELHRSETRRGDTIQECGSADSIRTK